MESTSPVRGSRCQEAWKARSITAIKTIPLSRPETDLRKTLNECSQSGETIVVEMPDQRLLTIQSLDLQEDNSLVDELLASNAKFQIAGREVEGRSTQTVQSRE